MFDDLRRKYRWRVFVLFGGVFVVWSVSALAPLTAVVLALVGKPDFAEAIGNHGLVFLMWSGQVAFVGLLSLVVVTFVDHRLVPFLLRARLPESPDELRVIDDIDTLMLATGELRPRILFVDSAAVNAAVVGRRSKRTLVITTGALTRPKAEVDALLAIALARQFMGKIISGRLQLVVSGPFLMLRWVLRFVSQHESITGYLIAAYLVFYVPLLLGIAFAVYRISEILTVLVLMVLFATTAGLLLTVSCLPAVLGWLVLIVFTGWMGDRLSRPAAIDADIAGVSLTRYPIPLLTLLNDARDFKTGIGRRAWGTSALWVLPYGYLKAHKLQHRIANMKALARV